MTEVTDTELFHFLGDYRVQSWRKSQPSSLSGRWVSTQPDQPTEATVNAQLMAHPHWGGDTRVALRAAIVTGRRGAFAEPDILYKCSNFLPATSSPAMTTNIVDVRKATANWRRRLPLMRRLLGEDAFGAVDEIIGDIERIVVDEYMFHEAGHCLGYSTDQKYRDGYFRLGGATRWPLIYVEELRADLLAFGLAADALATERAAAMMLYNLLLRVAADVEAGPEAPRPYGFIPSILVSMLEDCGWLTIAPASPRIRMASLDTRDISTVMSWCGAEIISNLVILEQSMCNPIDVAIHTAIWLNSRLRKGLGHDQLK